MLKTNSKKANENIKKYIIEGCNVPFETEQQAFNGIYKAFRVEKYSTPEYYHNEYEAFYDWCAGLCDVSDTTYFLCRAVDVLGAILEETEEEKKRYTETQAEKLLTQLIYQIIKQDIQHNES